MDYSRPNSIFYFKIDLQGEDYAPKTEETMKVGFIFFWTIYMSILHSNFQIFVVRESCTIFGVQ